MKTFQPVRDHRVTLGTPRQIQLSGFIPDPTGGWLTMGVVMAGAAGGAYYLGQRGWAPLGGAMGSLAGLVVGSLVFE